MDKLNYYKKKYLKYKEKYLGTKKIKNQIEINEENNPVKAIGFFNGPIIKGIVKFTEDLSNNKVKIAIDLSGFDPDSTHGFHIHESGDLTSGCESMCDHFNPYNKNHGGINDIERHVGDLGNIIANSEGLVQIEFSDHLIKLSGNKANVIGRGLIIHEGLDDCGKGIDQTSKKNGNSGKRIGCAIIGYASTH